MPRRHILKVYLILAYFTAFSVIFALSMMNTEKRTCHMQSSGFLLCLKLCFTQIVHYKGHALLASD